MRKQALDGPQFALSHTAGEQGVCPPPKPVGVGSQLAGLGKGWNFLPSRPVRTTLALLP